MATDLDQELARYMNALRVVNQHDGQIGFEELRTTPLFSWPVKTLSMRTKYGKQSENPHVFRQYALMGVELRGELDDLFSDDTESSDESHISEAESLDSSSLIFLNTDAPWSAFICGSQGSGKSYSLSCMLENCLLQIPKIGVNPRPLSGIAFHYDNHFGSGVCELAYLGNLIPIRVLCSPSNYHELKKKYDRLGNPNISVFPLFFKDKHLNTQRMMRLMAFNEKEGSVPLYMEVLFRILKEMAVDAAGKSGFNYSLFRKKTEDEDFSRDQKGPLQLRLQLLESFMESGDLAKKLPRAKKEIFQTKPSHLTIVDLTDPFVDPASACVLFDICLAIFLQDGDNAGKVVALDEAHKFMEKSSASIQFTEHLLSVIREQRHNGTRVIISTQEPTISPKLLDLCSMTFVHRFTSPDWLSMLQKHLAGASFTSGHTRETLQELFRVIVKLNVGEFMLFSPSAMLSVVDDMPQKLGVRPLKGRTRPRLTNDGGKSMMASSSAPAVGGPEQPKQLSQTPVTVSPSASAVKASEKANQSSPTLATVSSSAPAVKASEKPKQFSKTPAAISLSAPAAKTAERLKQSSNIHAAVTSSTPAVGDSEQSQRVRPPHLRDSKLIKPASLSIDQDCQTQ